MKRTGREKGPLPVDETVLMERVRDGDSEAFAILADRYLCPLLNFFRRLGVYPDAEAEDLVQDTFLRIYRNRANYRPRAAFRTYLYTVARSVWVDWVRRRSRYGSAMSEYGNCLDVAAYRDSDGHPALDDVQAAVDALPEKLKLVVVMSVYQELKYAEISEVLGIPVGTVKSRMHLAVGRLKELLCDAGIEIHES